MPYADPEKLKQYKIQWRQEHKEERNRKEREKRAIYRIINPLPVKVLKPIKIRICQQCKIFLTIPKVRFCSACAQQRKADSSKRYYQSHREVVKHRVAKWNKENREYALEIRAVVQARRKSRLRDALCTLTPAEWIIIKEEYLQSCAYCFRNDVKLTMDHIIPISKGGPHAKENIVPACMPCNSKKGDKAWSSVC